VKIPYLKPIEKSFLNDSELIGSVIKRLLQPKYLSFIDPMVFNDVKQFHQWDRIRESELKC